MRFEQELVARLNESGIQAYGAVPNPRPKSFVSVGRVGGGIDKVFDSPLIAVQAWAPSWVEADALMDAVVSLIHEMPDGSRLTRVDVTNVTRFEDDSGQPRMQAIVHAITHR